MDNGIPGIDYLPLCEINVGKNNYLKVSIKTSIFLCLQLILLYYYQIIKRISKCLKEYLIVFYATI
jgi:hypothetical protein